MCPCPHANSLVCTKCMVLAAGVPTCCVSEGPTSLRGGERPVRSIRVRDILGYRRLHSLLIFSILLTCRPWSSGQSNCGMKRHQVCVAVLTTLRSLLAEVCSTRPTASCSACDRDGVCGRSLDYSARKGLQPKPSVFVVLSKLAKAAYGGKLEGTLLSRYVSAHSRHLPDRGTSSCPPATIHGCKGPVRYGMICLKRCTYHSELTRTILNR